MNLFDYLDDTPIKPKLRDVALTADWTPKPPPQIRSRGIREICLDFETTGLRWWAGDVPVGAGVCLPDGSTEYVAWGHRGGGNTVSEAQAAQWMRDELAGVYITNLNTRFEIHMARNINVDLDALGCTFSDVSQHAALLDDHRLKMSQDAIVSDYLPDERKVTSVNGIPLDMSRVADYHASIIAVRAEADVRQVHKLKHLFAPMLDAEDLQRVRQLEDDYIPVIAEMEKNGAPIDLELLHQWQGECREWQEQLLFEIKQDLGFYADPSKSVDMQRVFKHEGLPITERTDPTLKNPDGNPSFTDEVLDAAGNALVRKCAIYRGLKSLEAKYLSTYAKQHINGILYYAIHQLRAQKSDDDDNSAGTITGRTSSSAFTWKVKGKEHKFGVNIQQCAKPGKQIKKQKHDRFIIRQLFKPASGLWASADAMQIEYRLFADKAKNPHILQRYAEDPRMSFHKEMHEVIKTYKSEMIYSDVKNLNFAKIYAAGLAKMAYMMNYISKREMKEIQRDRTSKTDERLDPVREINRIYAQAVPEVAPLLKLASHLAMPECNDYCKTYDDLHRRFHTRIDTGTEVIDRYEHRGFVKTIDGRRGRFPNGARIHKALNFVIQGSAASIAKRKGVELHRERKSTGFLMRLFSHDEYAGDIPDQEHAQKVHDILDRQSFPQLKVLILWDMHTGPNWRACGDD